MDDDLAHQNGIDHLHSLPVLRLHVPLLPAWFHQNFASGCFQFLYSAILSIKAGIVVGGPSLKSCFTPSPTFASPSMKSCVRQYSLKKNSARIKDPTAPRHCPFVLGSSSE